MSSASSTFNSVSMQLCNEMVAQLSEEHAKEVGRMWNEVSALRDELARVQGLLEGYLGREQVLRELIEDMMYNHKDAMQTCEQMHGQFQQHAHGVLQDHEAQRRQIGDPVRDAQNEIARIQGLLKTPAVPQQVNAHLHKPNVRY